LSRDKLYPNTQWLNQNNNSLII